MTVREALMFGRKRLLEVGIVNPTLDTELILGHVLKTDRLKLLVNDEINLTDHQLLCYENLLAQRCRFIPIAYILGRKEFYGLNFYIKPQVLIPRPETEFVVEETLKAIAPIKNPIMAELCCGSGAISVAVAVNNSKVKVYASDVSNVACEVSRKNIKNHQVEDRVLLFLGDLWSPFKERNIGNFDVVVSNPPYIPTGQLRLLPDDVKSEPQIALNGGNDGLEFYRRIIFKTPKFLRPGGTIIFEIGWNQADDVKDLLRKMRFRNIKVIKDYAGFDRVVSAVMYT